MAPQVTMAAFNMPIWVAPKGGKIHGVCWYIRVALSKVSGVTYYSALCISRSEGKEGRKAAIKKDHRLLQEGPQGSDLG